jgi:hypothetical protein
VLFLQQPAYSTAMHCSPLLIDHHYTACCCRCCCCCCWRVLQVEMGPAAVRVQAALEAAVYTSVMSPPNLPCEW